MAKNKDKTIEVKSFAFEYRLKARYNGGMIDAWKPCTELQKAKLEKTSPKYEFQAKNAPNPTESMVVDGE